MDTSKLKPSPSRTYVIPMYANSGYEEICFKKFTLPENYKNTCASASWYYYNRLDLFGCGFSAFPFEMFDNLTVVEPE